MVCPATDFLGTSSEPSPQVLSLMVCPALLDQPGVDALFAPDAIARATRLVHPRQGGASSFLTSLDPWLDLR